MRTSSGCPRFALCAACSAGRAATPAAVAARAASARVPCEDACRGMSEAQFGAKCCPDSVGMSRFALAPCVLSNKSLITDLHKES